MTTSRPKKSPAPNGKSSLRTPQEVAKDYRHRKEAESGWVCCKPPLKAWLDECNVLRKSGRGASYDELAAELQRAGFKVSPSALSKHFRQHILHDAPAS